MGELLDSSIDNEEKEWDPELLKLREDALASQQVNYEKLVEDLCQKVQNVHCSYLFHSKGKEALRRICLCISSTPADPYHVSWKDLAGFLGLTFLQIGCIDGYNQDKTELTLWAFSQKSEATLSQLAVAFLKIQRFDTLVVANELFPALADYAVKDFEKRMRKPGYEYNAIQGKLIRPEGYSLIRLASKYSTLEDPSTWLSSVAEKKIKQEDKPFKEIARIEKAINSCSISPSVNLPKPKSGKKIMLTFASDCQDIAEKVAREFRKKRENMNPCLVLILSEHPDKVAANPYDFITHQFERANYIVPILSPRYFEVLCDNSSQHFHETDHLDEANIKLIFNLMQHFYYSNNCINTKLRFIIPEIYKSVIKEHHFKINPIFMAYTFDRPDSIEKFVCQLAKATRK